MPRARKRNAVDEHVGARVRARRAGPASFANMIKIEEVSGLAPDAMRRLAALGILIKEDAERLREKLRLFNSESERLASIANRWWRVSPALG